MATREWNIGTHRVWLESPDLVLARFNGPATVEDAQRIVEVYREVCGEKPRYLLADIGQSSMDAPTRKFLGNAIRPEWFSGVVYVGANAFLRTVSNALNFLVLFNAKVTYETSFVATDAEARALIDGWRLKRAAPASAGRS